MVGMVGWLDDWDDWMIGKTNQRINESWDGGFRDTNV